jgi:hypothetical protein
VRNQWGNVTFLEGAKVLADSFVDLVAALRDRVPLAEQGHEFLAAARLPEGFSVADDL